MSLCFQTRERERVSWSRHYCADEWEASSHGEAKDMARDAIGLGSPPTFTPSTFVTEVMGHFCALAATNSRSPCRPRAQLHPLLRPDHALLSWP
jgi:hypothetical protein